MRAFLAILLYFLAVMLGAALLLPWVAPWLAQIPPEKLLRHVGRLLLYLVFFLMIRWLGVNNRRDLGYDLARGRFLAQMGLGWLAGLWLLGSLVFLLWLLEIRYYAPAGSLADVGRHIVSNLIGGAISGILIGLLEETFFRGMVYSAVRRESGIAVAVVLSSAFYAAMHFISASAPPAGTPLAWDSGLALLPSVGSNLLDLGHLDSFIALFVAGVLLALVREYTGNIALAIGIHAGWVTVIKETKYLLDTNRASDLIWLVGSYDEISGLLGAVLLSLSTLPLIARIRRRERGKA